MSELINWVALVNVEAGVVCLLHASERALSLSMSLCIRLIATGPPNISHAGQV